MLCYSPLLSIPRSRAAEALGISVNKLGGVCHRLGIKWPRSRKHSTPHRLVKEGSGPCALVGQLLWKRNPVLFHYWLMFADKGAADGTACVIPEATPACGTKSRRTLKQGTAAPCDPQGAAGLLWSWSFKCDACRGAKILEKKCYLQGPHTAWRSYAVK